MKILHTVGKYIYILPCIWLDVTQDVRVVLDVNCFVIVGPEHIFEVLWDGRLISNRGQLKGAVCLSAEGVV